MPQITKQRFGNSDQQRKYLTFRLIDRLSSITNRGFTLIELLVAIAIMAILTTLALAGYNNINATQQVKNSALELQSELRKYQSFALAGNKRPLPGDTSCDTVGNTRRLEYYSILIDTSAKTFSPILRCYLATNNLDKITIDLAEIGLPAAVDSVTVETKSGATISPCSSSPIEIQFFPSTSLTKIICGGEIAPPAEMRIRLVRTGDVTYEILISSQGQIDAKKL